MYLTWSRCPPSTSPWTVLQSSPLQQDLWNSTFPSLVVITAALQAWFTSSPHLELVDVGWYFLFNSIATRCPWKSTFQKFQVLDCLDQFDRSGRLWTHWTVIDYFKSLGPFWTVLDHFTLFRPKHENVLFQGHPVCHIQNLTVHYSEKLLICKSNRKRI